MVSNVAVSMPNVSQQTVSQSGSSSSSSDSYRDMMDKVVQSDKSTDNASDRTPTKNTENTGKDEAVEKTDDQVKKEAAEKAVSENPVALFFTMQMDAAAEQLNELTGMQTAVNAEEVAAIADIMPADSVIQDGLVDVLQEQMVQTLPEQAQNAQDVLAQGAVNEVAAKPETPIVQTTPVEKPVNKPVEAMAENTDSEKAENAVMAKDAGLSKAASQKRNDEGAAEEEQENTQDGSQQAGFMREPVYDNVEIHKTAQPVVTQETAQQTTSVEEIVDQLPKDLVDKIALGQKEFMVQLEPENLGKLMIKASFEDGKAMISIFCTNEKTLELLSSHARELGSIMESNMGTPTNIVLDKAEDNYLNQQRNDEQANQQARQEMEEQERRRQEQNRPKQETVDFLSQLRLGLI